MLGIMTCILQPPRRSGKWLHTKTQMDVAYTQVHRTKQDSLRRIFVPRDGVGESTLVPNKGGDNKMSSTRKQWPSLCEAVGPFLEAVCQYASMAVCPWIRATPCTKQACKTACGNSRGLSSFIFEHCDRRLDIQTKLGRVCTLPSQDEK